MTISVIVGSTRQGRFSEKPAQWILEHLRKREGIEGRLLDLRDFPMPFFDQPMPPAMPGRPPYEHDVVQKWTAQIAASDGFIFVTPEYNYSMPGVLKNAIDWASRPPDQPFAGKPVAIMGAAAGMAGSARAQYDLRRSCVFLDMHPLNKPEVLIGQAQTKFDDQGKLTDEAARGFIRDLMANLAGWARLHRKTLTQRKTSMVVERL